MNTLANHPMATRITIYTLGIFLGLIHVFMGLEALSPFISQDYHRDLKASFNVYAKSLTFVYSFVDRITLAQYLRYFIGFCQLIFGVLLMENGHFNSLFSTIGNFGLLALNAKLLLLQLNVQTPLERLAPTLVFTLLLITRLVIVEQGNKRGRVGVKTRNAGKPKTSTPKKNKNE